jgi:hypothetical protein
VENEQNQHKNYIDSISSNINKVQTRVDMNKAANISMIDKVREDYVSRFETIERHYEDKIEKLSVALE